MTSDWDKAKKRGEEAEKNYQLIADLEEYIIRKRPTLLSNLCRIATITGDFSRLKAYLGSRPRILETMEMRKAQKKIHEKEFPISFALKPAELKRLAGDLWLGYVDQNGNMAGIDVEELCKNMLLLGVPGTGKTYTIMRLLNLFYQVPIGQRGFNVIIIDVKNDYTHFAAKYKHIHILNQRQIRHNFFETWEGNDIYSHIRSAAGVFCEENYFQALSKPVIENALYNYCVSNRVFEGSQKYPTMTELLEEIAKEEKKSTKGNQMKDVFSKINQRLRVFINAGETFNTRRGFPLSYWMDNDIILQLDDDAKEINRSLAVDIATKIYNYRKVKNIRGQGLKTLIVCDEGGWLFNAERDDVQHTTTDSIDNLLLRGREFGMGWIVGVQQASKASKVIRQNAQYLLSFFSMPESDEENMKLLGITKEQTESIRTLGPKLKAIGRFPRHFKPFLMQVPEDFHMDKNITQDEINAHMAPIIKELYASISAKVEDKTTKAFINTFDDKPAIKIILLSLMENPFLWHTMLCDHVCGQPEAHITKAEFVHAMNGLRLNGLITDSVKCLAAKKAWAEFYPLTTQAYDLLGVPESRRIDESRFKHTYYAFRVFEALKRNKNEAKLEYCPPSYQNKMERVDVATVKSSGEIETAYEITLSHSSISKNARKCVKMQADKIFFVCEGAKAAAQSEQLFLKTPLLNNETEEDRKRIKFVSVTEFL